MFYADLHIHSKYSRATSRDCDLENLAFWACKKGIRVIGTGDFTHPAWRRELRDKLLPAEPGLFRLRPEIQREVERRLPAICRADVRFMLSVEISTIKGRQPDDWRSCTDSCQSDAPGQNLGPPTDPSPGTDQSPGTYSDHDTNAGSARPRKTYKVHHLVYAPDLDSVDAIVARLGKVAGPKALPGDGRPIIGMDPRDLLEVVLESGPDCYLVPAHVWTPHFAMLGSKSGFDRVVDCYQDLAEHIFAIETGLSSDPEMNWRVSQLDRYTLVSNSDAHSPSKLAREANLFSCEPDYYAIRRALETRVGFEGTCEFFPEEGKYHLDGHRKCGVVLEPEITREHQGLCPECRRPLTIGVMHRVQELADRPEGYRPENATPYRSLVPLPEVIAEIAGVGSGSKTVARDYDFVLSQLGSELDILERTPVEDIASRTSSRLAEAVTRMRAGTVIRKPGFDGEYGVIRLFEDDELGHEKRVRRGKKRPPAAIGQTTGPDEQPASPRTPAPTAPAPSPRGVELANTQIASIHTQIASIHLAGLDPDQRAAASITRGALLIVAGPGTGKTRTLTRRIAHLVTEGDGSEGHGVAPESCLAITFTNRAAGEMRERLHAIIPESAERLPVATFHSLSLRILQENRQACGLQRGFQIATEDRRVELLAAAMAGTKNQSPRKARRMLSAISQARRSSAVAAFAPGAGNPGLPATPGLPGARSLPKISGELSDEISHALATYRQAMEAAALIDFDDLLIRTVELLGSDQAIRDQYRARYRHVSIDEYQDIDELQYRLIGLLCPPDGNLCAIGDPDQAIYGFRGADVGFFLRFEQDYPGAQIAHLTRNYRSSHEIVTASLQAIAPSSLVKDRILVAAGPHASPSRYGISSPGISLPGIPLPGIPSINAASDRAEAEFVVHTIERLIGGLSFFSMDSGRLEDDDHTGNHAPSDDGHELAFCDFAVLYRTDAQTPPLVEALSRAGIPFQKRSHDRLSDRPGVSAITRHMTEQRQAGDDSPLRALLHRAVSALHASHISPITAELATAELATSDLVTSNLATSGAVDSSLAAPSPADLDLAADLLLPLCIRADPDLDRLLYEIACNSEVDTWDPRADRVSLLTLHASKGLEFPVVFLIGCESGILPFHFGGAPRPVLSGDRDTSPCISDWDLDEERRLFFVGMTRAKQQLYLTRARKRMWRGKIREFDESSFLDAIDDSLLISHKGGTGRRKKKKRHAQLGLL